MISDSTDTLVGLRLAGVEGISAHTAEEVRAGLKRCRDNPEIGIVLMTDRLSELCPEAVLDMKLNSTRPLLLTIPDRHGPAGRSNISKYIKDAIGVDIS